MDHNVGCDMTNIEIKTWEVKYDGEKYIFTSQDRRGNHLEVAGTITELAFNLFNQYMSRENNGYGELGPFWVSNKPDTTEPDIWICFDEIRPDWSVALLEQLNQQLQRFINLKAFW